MCVCEGRARTEAAAEGREGAAVRRQKAGEAPLSVLARSESLARVYSHSAIPLRREKETRRVRLPLFFSFYLRPR